MKTICFALQKGGVGKTSMSVSTACELANRGNKVLLIDADPQGNASGWLIESFNYEFADVLYGSVTVREAVVPSAKIPNLYVLPTTGIGSRLNEYSETKALNEPYRIADDLIPQIKLDNYDYCIIDTSPSFKALEKSCIASCDEVIAVLTLSNMGSDGLTIFADKLTNARQKLRLGDKPIFNKIILNNRNESFKQQKDILEQIEEGTPNFIKFKVPQDQAFDRACGGHGCIDQFNAKDKTIIAIREIAGSIA